MSRFVQGAVEPSRHGPCGEPLCGPQGCEERSESGGAACCHPGDCFSDPCRGWRSKRLLLAEHSEMSTEAEQQLLHDARNGNCEEVRQLLETMDKEEVVVDINCKGRSKSNLGWTPLHLACYFGHGNVVKDLLKAGAEVNVLNDMGDTPLHRAAFTGRKEVVMLLLQYDADTSIVNGSGQTARDVTQDKEINNMLEAVERTQERKLEELLLGAAREGETAKLSALLNRPKPPDINCTDQMGNTPLHCAAYRAHKHCALKLLKNGADSKIRNKNDQTPFDLAQGAEMKQILGGSIGKVINKRLKRYEGLLWKVKSTDSCLFYVKCFDDSVHSFKVPKNSPPMARENWLEAIEDHSAYSTHYCTQEQLSDEEDDDTVSVAELQETLKKAQTCQQRLDKEISNFLIMIKSCNTTKDCLQRSPSKPFAHGLMQVRNLKLEHEQEKNKILSEALETLATEHHELEQSLVKGSPPLSILSEEQFYDAVSDSESEKSLSGFETVTTYSEDSVESNNTITSSMSEEKVCSGGGKVCGGGGESLSNGIKKHRTSLPSPMFSRNDFSIWSILRKCIGMVVLTQISILCQELSKITMPVIFNEPLSFLQRLTEYMEHTYLIHQASSLSGTVERMQVGNSEEPDEMPLPDSESVHVVPGSILLWRIAPRPPNSVQMYNFTSFAMALNELDKEMESVVPKTDCRLRPDIRAMENGEIDLASEEKKRLEEKQRAVRKNRSKSEEDWKTSLSRPRVSSRKANHFEWHKPV
ncbi:Oxysterol-binding protein-related protein 1 [Chelonia mydas]|uniref:Oxysterol-binding protein-related protein 1 n=1 Tax=Chelonia mydas TaxID=8469 RepID=M7C1X8_CHEMY|nr:Oxysterol-binding protein-related protein 1 [Chelonia mydas]